MKTYVPTTLHCTDYREDKVSATLSTRYHFGGGGDAALIIYSVENHPNDSRVSVDPRGIVQTLSSRMGTGGGNVPLILIEKDMKESGQ